MYVPKVTAPQTNAIGQIDGCEAQLVKAERMLKQLEERRVQITIGEKKLAAVEARLAEITQVGDELDRSLHSIASREQSVQRCLRRTAEAHESRFTLAVRCPSRARGAHEISNPSTEVRSVWPGELVFFHCAEGTWRYRKGVSTHTLV